MHYSFNAEVVGRAYDYATRRHVWTDADDWFSYPGFSGLEEWRNCAMYGCDEIAYLRWWFRHLPRNNGTNSEFEAYNYNNWCPLVAHPTCQPPWTP